MRSHIAIRFRPSLIIFVGETGQHIYYQLQEVIRLAGMDERLYQGIALLFVPAGQTQAISVSLPGRQPYDQDKAQASPDSHVIASHHQHQNNSQAGPLEHMIEQSIREIQSIRNLAAIGDAGYPLPNPRTQIYIVGQGSSKTMATDLSTPDQAQTQLGSILTILQKQLQVLDYHTLINLVLHTQPSKQAEARQQFEQPTIKNADYIKQAPDHPENASAINPATFCYLYEDRQSYPIQAFVTETDAYYAAAEALFTLIATGITTEPFFENIVQNKAGVITSSPFGSLGTSLIVCPEQAIYNYCSARLGMDMMQQWQAGFTPEALPPEQSKNMQVQAQSNVTILENWLKDNQERKYANGAQHPQTMLKKKLSQRLMPDLNVLISSQQPSGTNKTTTGKTQQDSVELLTQIEETGHERLQKRSQELFALFWTEHVQTLVQQQPSEERDWLAIVSQQAQVAEEYYQRWARCAITAWKEAEQRICTDLQYFTERLYQSQEEGPALATIYIHTLEERLHQLSTHLLQWRIHHQKDATKTQNLFKRLIASSKPQHKARMLNSGPQTPSSNTEQPVTASNIPAIALIAQETNSPDTQQVTQIRQNSKSFEEKNSINASQQPGYFQPDRNIEHFLIEQIKQTQERVPSVIAQMLSTIPFLIAIILSLYAFTWLTANRTLLVTIIISILFLVSAGHWLLHRKKQQAVDQVQENLLTYYRIMYASRCEKLEDQLRTALLSTVQNKIQSIRTRLDEMPDLLTTIHNQLAQSAQQIENHLFTSAAGSRDIYVVNGEQILQQEKNTLEEIVEQVNKVRTKTPVENWHQTAHTLHQVFVTGIIDQQISFFETDKKYIQQQVKLFSDQVMHPYCSGALLEVSPALSRPNIWRAALARAQNLPYQVQTGSQAPLYTFICGREVDIQAGSRFLPEDSYPVHISDVHHWILIAAFFHSDSSELPDSVSHIEQTRVLTTKHKPVSTRDQQYSQEEK